MTSKRKVIISALGKNGLSTMDDLGFHTGILRKSLHDNVKAAVQDGLVERTMDDITRHPAYLLTAKGRDWLVKNQNEVSGEQPQPTVGQNIGSDESASHVVGSLIAEPPSEVVTVIEPPKPDEAPGNTPAAVRSNAMQVQASGTMAKLVETLNKTINQQNRQILMLEEMIADFEQMAMNQVQTIKGLQAENETLLAVGAEMSVRIAALEGNEALNFEPTPLRYIVTDTYFIAKNKDEANEYAFKLAKEVEIDTPVMVFDANKARELRINWRDA